MKSRPIPKAQLLGLNMDSCEIDILGTLVEHFEFFSEKTGEKCKSIFTFSPHFCFELKNTCFVPDKIGEKKIKSCTNFFTEKLGMFDQW
jgi:hypothetical protein